VEDYETNCWYIDIAEETLHTSVKKYMKYEDPGWSLVRGFIWSLLFGYLKVQGSIQTKQKFEFENNRK
jgi:hypothetical protein